MGMGMDSGVLVLYSNGVCLGPQPLRFPSIFLYRPVLGASSALGSVVLPQPRAPPNTTPIDLRTTTVEEALPLFAIFLLNCRHHGHFIRTATSHRRQARPHSEIASQRRTPTVPVHHPKPKPVGHCLGQQPSPSPSPIADDHAV